MDHFVNLAEWCLIWQENHFETEKKELQQKQKKKLQFQQSIIPVIYIIYA